MSCLCKGLQVHRVVVSAIADSDGIEFDISLFDHLFDLFKRDLTHVVLSVGQQNDDLAFGFGFAEHVVCLHQCIIDRSTFPRDAKLLHLRNIGQKLLLKSQRRGDKCHIREGHHTDTVIFSFLDEILYHLFDHIKFALHDVVWIKAALAHRIRTVQYQYDVTPLFFGVGIALGDHRRCQRRHRQHDPQPLEQPKPCGFAHARCHQIVNVREKDRAAALFAPFCTDRKKDEEPKCQRIFKTKLTHHSPAHRG